MALNKTIALSLGVSLSGLLAACGHAQKTDPGNANLPRIPTGSTATSNAGPPTPTVVTVAQKASFAEAVRFFRDQDKAGWTSSSCSDSAGKFTDAGGDKLAEAYFDAGVAYHKCKDYDDAAKMYAKALSLDPNNGPTLSNLCEIAYLGGKLDDAKKYCQAAVDKDAQLQVTAARNIIAWIDYDQMRKEPDATKRKALETDAIGSLQRTLAIDNDNVTAYTLMAMIYMEGSEANKNRLDVAKLLLDEGEQHNAKYPPLWNAKGLLAMKKGDVAGALKNFGAAVQLDSTFFEAKLNLAQIILNFRKYQDAEAMFRDLVQQNPKSYDSLIGLGVSLRGEATQAKTAGATPQFQQAIADAEAQYMKALDLDKTRPDAYFNLALLWKDYKTGEATNDANIAGYLKAKDFFNQYLSHADKNDPNRQNAQSHIAQCDQYVAALKAAPVQPATPPPPPPTPTSAPAAPAGGTH